jgi:hypothetical protein
LPKINPRPVNPDPVQEEPSEPDKPISAPEVQEAINAAKARQDNLSKGFKVQRDEKGNLMVTGDANVPDPKPDSAAERAQRDLQHSNVNLNEPVDVTDDRDRPGHIRADPHVEFKDDEPPM